MTRDDRRSGAPDFDDIAGFRTDHARPRSAASRLIDGLCLLALACTAMVMLWLMVSNAFAAPTRPAACAAYAGAEAAACVQEGL